jgi:hypothetical protein
VNDFGYDMTEPGIFFEFVQFQQNMKWNEDFIFVAVSEFE